MGTELTDDEVTILDIEKAWWVDQDAKRRYVAATLAVSMPVYHARLARLVETDAAMTHDPHTVMWVREVFRVRRRREQLLHTLARSTR